MKKVLLTLAILGTIFLSACQKDEAVLPAEKTLLKADKGLLCRGCGQWDLEDENIPEQVTLRILNSQADSVSNVPNQPGKKKRGKKSN